MLRMWRRAAKQLDTVRDTWVFIDMSLSITDIYIYQSHGHTLLARHCWHRRAMERLDEAYHGHIQLQTVRLHPLGDVAGTYTQTVHESQFPQNGKTRRSAYNRRRDAYADHVYRPAESRQVSSI